MISLSTYRVLFTTTPTYARTHARTPTHTITYTCLGLHTPLIFSRILMHFSFFLWPSSVLRRHVDFFSFSWNSETVNNYLCFLENNSKQIPPEFYFLLSHITYRNLCSISFAFYRLIDWLIKIDRRASSTQILYHLLERILVFCTVYRFLTTNKSKTVYFSSFMYRIPSGRRRS